MGIEVNARPLGWHVVSHQWPGAQTDSRGLGSASWASGLRRKPLALVRQASSSLRWGLSLVVRTWMKRTVTGSSRFPLIARHVGTLSAASEPWVVACLLLPAVALFPFRLAVGSRLPGSAIWSRDLAGHPGCWCHAAGSGGRGPFDRVFQSGRAASCQLHRPRLGESASLEEGWNGRRIPATYSYSGVDFHDGLMSWL